MSNTLSIDLPLLDKLKICWGVLFPVELFMWNNKYVLNRINDKNMFIFNKGYRVGMADQKAPGEYKATVTDYFGNTDSFFDDLSEAVKFVVNKRSEGSLCEIYQTYLDRDLEHLLPAK
jgi:hypothetical protein